MPQAVQWAEGFLFPQVHLLSCEAAVRGRRYGCCLKWFMGKVTTVPWPILLLDAFFCGEYEDIILSCLALSYISLKIIIHYSNPNSADFEEVNLILQNISVAAGGGGTYSFLHLRGIWFFSHIKQPLKVLM